jgi:hypothetical protein
MGIQHIAPHSVVLNIDEFDSVCDEFLKVYDTILQPNQTHLNESQFQQYRTTLMGANVCQFKADNSRSAPQSAESTKAITGIVHTCSPDCLQKVELGNDVKNTQLTGPACYLFVQKRELLLSLSFKDIQTNKKKGIDAVDILTAIGLDSAIDYMRATFDENTKITEALWPDVSFVIEYKQISNLS